MNKCSVLVLLFFGLFLASSCGNRETKMVSLATPSPTAVSSPTAVPSPTKPPQPTLTPALSETIGSLLVQSGELPDGFSAGEVTEGVPKYIDLQGVRGEESIFQAFKLNDLLVGGVTVVHRGNYGQARFSIVYDELGWANGIRGIEIDPGLLFIRQLGENPGMDFMIFPCDAVIHIRMLGDIKKDTLVSYAKALNERLAPILCEGAEPILLPSSTPAGWNPIEGGVIERLLFQQGNLPDGYLSNARLEVNESIDHWKSIFKPMLPRGIPQPDQVLELSIFSGLSGTTSLGSIWVWYYADPSNVHLAYEKIFEPGVPTEIPGMFGEQVSWYPTSNDEALVFTRCSFLYYILLNDVDKSSYYHFAKILDDRLYDDACQ